MIHQVAEFIEWMLEQSSGEDQLAEIISCANNKMLMESLAEISRNMNVPAYHRHYAMKSVIVLDDYLEIEGWYNVMKEDKENSEPGCEGIAEQDKDNAYSARWPL